MFLWGDESFSIFPLYWQSRIFIFHCFWSRVVGGTPPDRVSLPQNKKSLLCSVHGEISVWKNIHFDPLLSDGFWNNFSHLCVCPLGVISFSQNNRYFQRGSFLMKGCVLWAFTEDLFMIRTFLIHNSTSAVSLFKKINFGFFSGFRVGFFSGRVSFGSGFFRVRVRVGLGFSTRMRTLLWIHF